MRTLSYLYGEEREIKSGETYYFGQLWDGEGDGQELLESGSIAVYNADGDFVVYDFDLVDGSEDDVMHMLVRVK